LAFLYLNATFLDDQVSQIRLYFGSCPISVR
jgi:hypothetical protein